MSSVKDITTFSNIVNNVKNEMFGLYQSKILTELVGYGETIKPKDTIYYSFIAETEHFTPGWHGPIKVLKILLREDNSISIDGIKNESPCSFIVENRSTALGNKPWKRIFKRKKSR